MELQEDSDGSEEPQSSDVDDVNIVGTQPVYPEFSFGMVDRKRKIEINWKVENVVSSSVASNPYLGETKLNWRSSGVSVQSPKTELDYFLLMDVPVTQKLFGDASILTLTNEAIEADPNRRGKGNMTKCVVS